MSDAAPAVSFELEYCPTCRGMRMVEKRAIDNSPRVTLKCVKCRTAIDPPYGPKDPPLDSRALGDLDLMR